MLVASVPQTEAAQKRQIAQPAARDRGINHLGAAYLGGFSFRELAAAERLEEVARGGLARADALFATPVAPWCPEIF